MSNETVKKVMAEKRRMTIGQLTDQLVSGTLRRELGMDKTEFATLVSVMRSTIRRIEGLEATPRMGLIFNTAAVLRIGIDFPITEERAKKMTTKTDITELARERLKEKFDVWFEREYKHLESSKYTDAVPHIKYGFWTAYQAGGAELVEALEKAQAKNALVAGARKEGWRISKDRQRCYAPGHKILRGAN